MLSLSYFLSVSLVLFRTFSLVLASETELTNKICRREKCSWTNQILMNQISWRIGALNVCHFSAIERFQLTDCSCWKIVLSTPCDAEIQKEECRQCVVWASWDFGKKVTVSCTLLSLACPLSGWSPKISAFQLHLKASGFYCKTFPQSKCKQGHIALCVLFSWHRLWRHCANPPHELAWSSTNPRVYIRRLPCIHIYIYIDIHMYVSYIHMHTYVCIHV